LLSKTYDGKQGAFVIVISTWRLFRKRELHATGRGKGGMMIIYDSSLHAVWSYSHDERRSCLIGLVRSDDSLTYEGQASSSCKISRRSEQVAYHHQHLIGQVEGGAGS
jgi:hypothetical protein